MAIQPEFSQAILAGTKTIEFRKRRLAEDIESVLVYETAPTQRIVGYFTIASVVEVSPSAMWTRFGTVGGISRQRFRDYYQGSPSAVGLVIGAVVSLDTPIRLGELASQPAIPQSFVYLPTSAISEVCALQRDEPRDLVSRLSKQAAWVGQRLKSRVSEARHVPLFRT